MKTIQILSLKLENFKCHKALTMTFDGKSRTIYGDNAAGKTSVYDGLTWLLFGKTSSGSSDNELLKPVGADGQVLDHSAITAVEAVLLVTDTTPSVGCADSSPAEQGSLVRTVTLRRELQEIWTTHRGSAEPVYDGNVSAYYIDGVPMKKNEYDRRVAELVDETAFRLLTSVSFFAETMPWKDRRAVLAELCGNISDVQLMAEDVRFAALLAKLGTMSVDDYRKTLAARKKGLSADRDTLPARISEQENLIASLSGTDFDAVQNEYDMAEADVRELEGKLNSVKNDTQTEKLQARLSVLSAELDKLYAENRAHRAEQEKKKPDTAEPMSRLSYLKSRHNSLLDDLSKKKTELERNMAHLDKFRAQWEAENAKVFDGDMCPYCGQRLPQDKIREGRESFAERKKTNLAEIELFAGDVKAVCGRLETEIAAAEKEIKDSEKQIADTERRLKEAKKAADAVTVVDMEDYAARKDAIEAEGKTVRDELSELMKKSDGVRKAVELQLTDARLKAKHLSEQLGCRGALDFAEKRIEELRAQQQEAAKRLEEIDRDLILIEDFVRFKAKRVEERVNGCFRLATFRLFKELVSGGLEECCDAVHDGVTYAALNNGMRINIGLDIIRTLSDHYGVRVPLFVDNAESITELEDAGTQTIRLVVSAQDKSLRME